MATMPSHIMTRLAANLVGISTVDATRNIFEGVVPDSPNRIIVLTEGAGIRPDRVMKGGSVAPGAGINSVNPMLQVKCRDTTRALAHTLMASVFADLDGFVGTLSGVRYLWIEALHDPQFIGMDEKKRFIYVVNFRVKKEIG